MRSELFHPQHIPEMLRNFTIHQSKHISGFPFVIKNECDAVTMLRKFTIKCDDAPQCQVLVVIIFQDHKRCAYIVSSPTSSSDKVTKRGVHNLDSAPMSSEDSA
jgi:hypothetical protein